MARTCLTTNAEYWCNYGTGSDSAGNGSQASPWQTIQNAINVLQPSIDMCGFALTINVADTTYQPGFVLNGPWVGCAGPAYVQIIGDVANPQNCVIGANGQPGIAAWGDVQATVAGFKTVCVNPGSWGVQCADSYLMIGAMNYGQAYEGFVHCAGNRGRIQVTAPQVISGVCSLTGFSAEEQSNFEINNIALTIDCNLILQYGLVNVDEISFMDWSGSQIVLSPGVTVTGPKGQVTQNSLLQTGGINFPGTSNFNQATGGQITN
jgi:hypothetical protein